MERNVQWNSSGVDTGTYVKHLDLGAQGTIPISADDKNMEAL